MKLSLIINTACGDPVVAFRRNPYRGAAYCKRKETIQHIVDAAEGFDQIILVGSIPAEMKLSRPTLKVSVPPQKRDRSDALRQREMGARFATGDVFVFTHDDHGPAPGFAAELRATDPEWDLLVPRRVHAITNEELNNGRADDYMGGHLLVMKRGLWATVPWTAVDTEYWDVPMTRIWRSVGGRIVWSDTLTSFDLEADENEA